MIIDRTGGAILQAELKYPIHKSKDICGSYKIIYWDGVSEEVRNDNEIRWYESIPTLLKGINKWAMVPLTKEEKEKIRADTRNALKKRFVFILRNYGYDVAENYFRIRKKDFIDAGLDIMINRIPRCHYNSENQCNLFCGYYFCGQCYYFEGDNNADDLQIFVE